MLKPLKALVLLALTAATITFSSCSKTTTEIKPKTASISAKIDGKLTRFDNMAIGITGEVNGQAFTSVQGTDPDGNTISFTINGALVAGKTYTSTATNYADKALLLYSTAADEIYINDDRIATTNASVTLSLVAGNNLQGTFKGSLATVASGNGATKVKVITEGAFNVKITD